MIPKDACLIFDMDGTLINSKAVLVKSIQYAVSHFGIHVENPDELTPLLGPPLTYSMQEYFNLSREDAQTAVDIFHQHYEATGMRKEEPFLGIADTLAALKGRGHLLGVATAAPQGFAQTILEHHQLSPYFEAIAGSAPTRKDKAQIIQHCLDLIELQGIVLKGPVMMIGDRDRDISAAKSLGYKSIGALYGYGSLGELELAGADHLIQVHSDLLVTAPNPHTKNLKRS